MNPSYGQQPYVSYAPGIALLSESPLEQIRKLVNLLMVFSMLMSIVSPIFTSAYGTCLLYTSPSPRD